jgi:uncharacterized membrane protein
MKRDLLKTASFAALHFGVAFTVTYALTGSVAVATSVGLIEPIANTIAFYFHERAWRRVDGNAGSRNNARAMCCGVFKAG